MQRIKREYVVQIIAAVIAFIVLTGGGLFIISAYPEQIEAWQKYVVFLISSIGTVITGFGARAITEQRKSAKSVEEIKTTTNDTHDIAQNNDERISYLIDEVRRVSVENGQLKKQLTKLTEKVEQLTKENAVLRVIIQAIDPKDVQAILERNVSQDQITNEGDI